MPWHGIMLLEALIASHKTRGDEDMTKKEAYAEIKNGGAVKIIFGDGDHKDCFAKGTLDWLFRNADALCGIKSIEKIRRTK